MRRNCIFVFLVGAILVLPAFANAAVRYWIATDTQSWSDTNYWSNSSGGSGGVSTPTFGDSAIFDGNGMGSCNIDIDVSVSSIQVKSGYSTGTIDALTYDINISSNLIVNDGKIKMGSGIWIVGGNVNLTGGTADAGTSELVMNGMSKGLGGAGQTLNDLTISGKIGIGGDISVSGILTVDSSRKLTIASTYTVRLNNGASAVLNGTIDGEGLLELIDSACQNLGTGGDLLVKTRFKAETNNVTVPERVYGGDIEFLNTSGTDRIVTLGTAVSQVITSSGNFFLRADGTGNITVDADTYDTGLEILGNIDYTGTGSGSESIQMGSGTWYLDGYIDLTGGTLDSGTSTLVMDGNLSGWSALGSGMNDDVHSLTVYNNELIAGGGFTNGGGDLDADYIAKWNGSSWSSLGSGMNDTVYALTVYNNELIAGGKFTVAGGVPADNIAKWDGTNWSSLGSGMSESVRALTVYNGDLIAGGCGTLVGGVIAKWDGTSWSSLGSGMSGGVDPDQALQGVFNLTVYNGDLIAGGNFTVAGGQPANFIARWDGTNWSSLGSGTSGDRFYVITLTVYKGDLIAGGSFTEAGGETVNYIAKWNGSSWSSLGTGMSGGSYTFMDALTVYNGDLIAGGGFSTAGGVSADNIAKWDGTNWSSLGSGIDNWVAALTVYNNDLIAGGYFITAGGVPANRIAKWRDPSVITSSGQSFNDVTIKNTSNNGVVLSDALSIDGNLYLDADGAIDVLLDASVSSPSAVISGNLAFVGTGSGEEKINLGGSTWTVSGSSADFSGGTVYKGTSTLVLDGSGKQILVSSGNALSILSVSNTSNEGVTLSDNLTVSTFSALNPGSTIYFCGGSTFTFTNFYLNGQAESTRIVLRSTETGTNWYLQVSGSQSVSYVDVQDSDASSGNEIIPFGGIDSGNNFNWKFPPLSPSSGEITNVYISSITATWALSEGATWYTLSGSTESVNPPIAIWASSGTSITTATVYSPSLNPNTTYYLFVKASNNDGESGWSLIGSTATLAVRPYPPVGVSTFTVVEVSAITLNWSSGTASIGYNPSGTVYEVSVSTDLFQTNFSTPVPFSSHLISISATAGGLIPNTTYSFRVRAQNHGGIPTGFSNVVTTVTLAAKPGYLGSDNVTLNSFTVNISSNGNPGGTLYEIDISTDWTLGYISSSTSTAATSADFSSLIDHTIYYIRLRGINFAGIATEYAYGTAITDPDAIILFSLTHPENTWSNSQNATFNVSQGPANVDKYHYRVSNSGTNGVTTGDDSFSGPIGSTSTTLPEGTWYFHVLGADFVGVEVGRESYGPIWVDVSPPVISYISAQKSASDATPIAEGSPTMFATPRFTWPEPSSLSPITGYSFSVSQNQGLEPSESTNTANKFWDYSFSTPGVYYVKVKAVDEAGNWGPSTSFTYNLAVVLTGSDASVRNNYFNPKTGKHLKVYYRLEKGGAVKMQIFTIRGELVKTLVDEYKSPGNYEIGWKGFNGQGGSVRAGLYYVVIKAPDIDKNFKSVLAR